MKLKSGSIRKRFFSVISPASLFFNRNNLYFIVDYQEPARLDRVYVYDLGNVLFYYQNHGENLERTVSYFYKKLLKDIKSNSDTCVLSMTEEMFVHTALKLEIKKLAFWLDHDLEEIL